MMLSTARILVFALLFGSLGTIGARAAGPPYAVISSFGWSVDDGAFPTGLVELDGALWGTTEIGGSPASLGALYRLTTAGRQRVVTFTSSGPKQGYPGPLIAGPDRTLYGTTGEQLFSVDPTTLQFTAIPLGGPLGIYGALVSDGRENVFGIAELGNISTPDCGAIYAYDVRTRSARTIYTLPWGSGTNACPLGQLSQDALAYANGVIYGSVRSRTIPWEGAIFSIHDDGSDFQIVHSFTGGQGDGGSGPGPIAISGGTIYGATTGNQGRQSPYQPAIAATLYAMHRDGSGLRVLYTFGTGSAWTSPNALVLGRDTIFGTTGALNSNSVETVFELSRRGEYTVLHQFTGSPDGLFPASLTLSRSGVLLGTTTFGGKGTGCASISPQEGCGTAFALLPPPLPLSSAVRGVRLIRSERP